MHLLAWPLPLKDGEVRASEREKEREREREKKNHSGLPRKSPRNPEHKMCILCTYIHTIIHHSTVPASLTHIYLHMCFLIVAASRVSLNDNLRQLLPDWPPKVVGYLGCLACLMPQIGWNERQG
ncbi:hypothetical protein LY76DRAFT_88529 [Colletotrichum caudatum]|nr:hypothetical protein LY76DRAFT_88529 [Colletotrichum caudatum]